MSNHFAIYSYHSLLALWASNHFLAIGNQPNLSWSKKIRPTLEIVAGVACVNSSASKTTFISLFKFIRKPLGKDNILVSSSKVLRDSIHKVSTGESNTSHFTVRVFSSSYLEFEISFKWKGSKPSWYCPSEPIRPYNSSNSIDFGKILLISISVNSSSLSFCLPFWGLDFWTSFNFFNNSKVVVFPLRVPPTSIKPCFNCILLYNWITWFIKKGEPVNFFISIICLTSFLNDSCLSCLAFSICSFRSLPSPCKPSLNTELKTLSKTSSSFATNFGLSISHIAILKINVSSCPWTFFRVEAYFKIFIIALNEKS